ncbi:hypothetical protein [Flagellimonas onchidii]|uniref:hypothetical protein n=1 Tax=Flagellimonas onchidii TaxID=2562684 RepID=UPI0010A5CEF6|nr:hypothetical protein [Allomuricauda onchidii]
MPRKSLSEIVKTILIFGLTSLVCGAAKNHLILNFFNDDVKNIATFASYTTMLISLLVSCIVLGLIALVCILMFDAIKFSEIFTGSIELNEFSKSYQNFIYVLMSGEFIKVFLVVFYLSKELPDIDIDTTFQSQLYNTDWFFYNSVSELFILFLANIVFIISFRDITKGYRVFGIFLLSLTIGVTTYISNTSWF